MVIEAFVGGWVLRVRLRRRLDKLSGRQHQSSDVCSQLFACMLASVGWQVSWSAVLLLSLQVSFISNCLIVRSRRENVGLLGWIHALECRSCRMFWTIEEVTNTTLPPSTLSDLHKFKLYFFPRSFWRPSSSWYSGIVVGCGERGAGCACVQS